MGEVLHIEDALNEKGVYVSTTSGVSMYVSNAKKQKGYYNS